MISGGRISRRTVLRGIGTAISLVVTVLCAYGLSRSHSFAHRPILLLLVATMFFSGGIIPMDLQQLGGTIIAQKDAFLCAAKGVSVGIHFQRKLDIFGKREAFL